MGEKGEERNLNLEFWFYGDEEFSSGTKFNARRKEKTRVCG